MTEIGYYRYEGYDLATKFAWINGAPGAQVTEPSRVAMGNLGNAFADSDHAVRDMLGPLGLEWRGTAATATAEALTQVARRGGEAGVASTTGGSSVDNYGQSFEGLRSRVAWEDPGEWDLWDRIVDGTAIAVQTPARVAQQIIGVEPDPFELASDYSRALEQNRTLDAQANAALYGHEQQAREALARFPAVEQAGGPAPVAPAGVGPGAGGGVRVPEGGSLLPGGVGPTAGGTAGVDPPPPIGGGGLGPGVPAGPPGAGGPTPVPIGPAAEGLPPGAVPPGAVPPGGVLPGGVPPAGVPPGGGPGGRTGGVPGGEPGNVPGGGPGGAPLAPAGGGGGRGGLDRPPIPGGTGLAPGGRAPAPGAAEGFPRATIPGSPGRPGLPDGRPTYPPAGGSFPPGSAERAGAGPGRTVPTGSEFGGRLGTGGPVADNRPAPVAPAAATGAIRGTAVGPQMPFMGGMGAGAGAGAEPTEHRTKYWIPSSEAFDADLPPYVDPVIEGRPE